MAIIHVGMLFIVIFVIICVFEFIVGVILLIIGLSVALFEKALNRIKQQTNGGKHNGTNLRLDKMGE